MIIYGGGESTVRKQLECEHDWHGPCMGVWTRYYKCLICYCVDHDLDSEEEYYERRKESKVKNAVVLDSQSEE